MSFNAVEFIRTQTEVKAPPLVPEIRLHLAGEFTPLWQMTEDSLRRNHLPPPFWAIAWPGGQGIARYILDHPELVRGKRVVDFAAGSGLAAIAAMQAGAKNTLAVDIDDLALAAIALNAENNKVVVKTESMIELAKPYKTDVILAGDICYEQMMSVSIVRWLRLCVEREVLVLLADPGRAYVPTEGLTKLASYDVPTSKDIEDKDIRTVSVWSMEKLKQ